MRYDLLKIWPSGILGCFLFSLGGEEDLEYRLFWYFFLGIWVFVGILSYSLNGKNHLKETLIDNAFGWLGIVVIIGLIAIPYLFIPLIALWAYRTKPWR